MFQTTVVEVSAGSVDGVTVVVSVTASVVVNPLDEPVSSELGSVEVPSVPVEAGELGPLDPSDGVVVPGSVVAGSLVPDVGPVVGPVVGRLDEGSVVVGLEVVGTDDVGPVVSATTWVSTIDRA